MFEIFSRDGHETFAVGDRALFDDILEITRGSDHFIDHQEGDEKLFELLEENKNEDILLFHRFVDVHFPYLLSHSPPNKDYLKESYDEAKRLSDRFGFDFVLAEKDYNDIEAHTGQWFSKKK